MTNTSNNISGSYLTRQQLELINKRTIQYPLPTAEKDYYLALAIKLIYNSPLKVKLVFKGGTALHHSFLSQKRFSEDLDFTLLDNEISKGEVVSVLESSGVFQVKKVHHSKYTLKIERLRYQGLLGQPGNIKIEIDHFQNVVLPGVKKKYKNVWKVNSTALIMDKREICAEKIRAVSQRARYRDFYDLFFLINELKINYKEAVELLRKKEIRTPVMVENIKKNWSIAKEQMKRDLSSIYCKEKISNEDIKSILDQINFLPIK